MKKILMICSLFLAASASYSQEEKNGDIYIKHPYIDVVNKSNKAYLAKDTIAAKALYADTARVIFSGMTKSMPISQALANGVKDFDLYDSIRIEPIGYPDYLAYKKDDAKVVQSWGTWFGKSKKTGNWYRVDFVQFDNFNKAGKIEFEFLYGDFSQFGKN